MNGLDVPRPRTLARRLVLGAVLVLALAVTAALPDAPSAQAQPTSPAASNARPPSTAAAPKAEPPAAAAAADAEPDAQKDSPGAEVTVGPGGITIDRFGKHVRVRGVAGDHEYDSFNELVQDEPWLAVLIFFAVALVFAVPLLIVIAVVWYKIRRARMLNEMVLKLAEKGVVPPAGALEALAANKPDVAERALSASAPAIEQMRIASRRTAWSDLRKGVVMLAIGVGLTFFSMLDDGTPNSVGLVLLFVGIGYIVLWWFEERQIASPRSGGPAAGA